MEIPSVQKRWLRQGGVFFGALALGVLSSILVGRMTASAEVLPGVHVEGRDLAGLDKAAAIKVFDDRARTVASREFVLVLDEDELKLTGKELGVAFDAQGVAASALAAGRSEGLFSGLGFSLARLFSAYEVAPAARVVEDILRQKVAPWVEQRVEAPALPELRYEKELIFSEGSGGLEVDWEELKAQLATSALGKSTRVDIPLKQREPAIPLSVVHARKEQADRLLSKSIAVSGPNGERGKLSPRKLGKALLVDIDEQKGDISVALDEAELRAALKDFLAEVETPPTEATFEFARDGEVTVTESSTGKRVDWEQLKKDLWAASRSDPRAVKVRLIIAAPNLTREDAEGLGVKELVSSFLTRHPCCQERVKNIHHAASILDGTVLRPGETFSLNKLLGPRTRASGYFMAPTIVRGEMKDSWGGGISQLATTLFNAVLRGGYEIVQRQPHSVWFPRYPEGHEATVSFPEPDLIFKNDTKAGMVIKTEYTPTFIKVLVYGDGEGRVTTVDKSKRYKIVDPPQEFEPDEEMDPEESKRLRAGQLGWTVRVSRTVRMADGTEKKEAREVVYNPRPELLRVHPCVIPEGEEGHTGEDCPEPEIEEVEEELSEDEYFETQ